MTKTNRLLNALRNGEELTAHQIVNRFGFASVESAQKTVSRLRTKDGFAIYLNDTPTGLRRYRLGTPSRAIVAAGYRAVAMGI